MSRSQTGIQRTEFALEAINALLMSPPTEGGTHWRIKYHIQKDDKD